MLYIVGFIPAAIYGFKWLGKAAFKRLGDDSSQQMMFLLLVIGISAGIAELVHIEAIVGAFLAGLAVSTTLPNANVRIQLDTMGNTLFIPAFFISLGVLIDPVIVIQTMKEHLLLVMAVVSSVFITKFLAAWLSGAKFGYSAQDRILIGSLIVPQVSSTLAVALVAYESMNASGERLIDEALLNSVLVLMVISAIGGTVITGQIGERIVTSRKT
jgi:Kef-type K+ transport system membrane component KefB